MEQPARTFVKVEFPTFDAVSLVLWFGRQVQRPYRVHRVSVDGQGLSATIPRFLKGAEKVRVPWSEVRAAMLTNETLWIEWEHGSLGFHLGEWFEDEDGRGRPRRRAVRLLAPEMHPLYEAVSAGCQIPPIPAPPPFDFRAEWAKVSLAKGSWIVLFVLLVLYSAYAPFGLSDGYVDGAFVEFCLFGTMVGAVGSALAVGRVTENGWERLVGSVMMAAACGWASYPIALQVNAIGADYVSYQYRYEGERGFEPLTGVAPPLRLSRFEDYWQAFPLGTVHTFSLRKGVLGFQQVHFGPIQRDYYDWRLHEGTPDPDHTDGERDQMIPKGTEPHGAGLRNGQSTGRLPLC